MDRVPEPNGKTVNTQLAYKTRIADQQDEDCYKLFYQQRRRPEAGLLVPSKGDRALGPGRPNLFTAKQDGWADGLIDVEFGGLKERSHSGNHKTRHIGAGPLTSCESRFRQIHMSTMDSADEEDLSAFHRFKPLSRLRQLEKAPVNVTS